MMTSLTIVVMLLMIKEFKISFMEEVHLI